MSLNWPDQEKQTHFFSKAWLYLDQVKSENKRAFFKLLVFVLVASFLQSVTWNCSRLSKHDYSWNVTSVTSIKCLEAPVPAHYTWLNTNLHRGTSCGNPIQMPKSYTVPAISSLYYLLNMHEHCEWTPQTMPGIKKTPAFTFVKINRVRSASCFAHPPGESSLCWVAV